MINQQSPAKLLNPTKQGFYFLRYRNMNKKYDIPNNLDEIVTIGWVREQMKMYNIRQQDIANDIVYSKGRVSDLLNANGRNPLSTKFQKLFFWLYFQNINMEITIFTPNQKRCFEIMTYALNCDIKEKQEDKEKEKIREFIEDCKVKGFEYDVVMRPVKEGDKVKGINVAIVADKTKAN